MSRPAPVDRSRSNSRRRPAPPLAGRVALVDSTALSAASAASMLPADDPRPTAWAIELDAMISTALTDEEVMAATAEIQSEADAIRGAVVPPAPFSFTLTGRSGDIELQVANTSSDVLTVILRASSAKLSFPGSIEPEVGPPDADAGDQIVTLRPNDDTAVIIPVRAKSNGTSPVTIQLLTPAGETIDDPVTVTATVTAFTGLGQVLTAGLVLVLLTWWATHWRSRRRAALAEVRERHPERCPVGSHPCEFTVSRARNSVRIVTDSSCDLPAGIADELGITIVPLTIRFGDEEFIDREELSTAEFWSRCVNTTSCPRPPPPRRASSRCTIGASPPKVPPASWSCRSRARCPPRCRALSSPLVRCRPTTSVDLDIRVLDSRSITMGLGTIALACARLARTGATIDEVEATAIDLIDRTRVFGALDTLENLKKGGRIGNAKALLATALSIKPIIEVTGGVVEQGGKQRTRSKALAYLVDKVKSYDGAIENLAVLHADCSDVDEFVADAATLRARRDRRRRDRSGDRHPRWTRHDRRRLPGHRADRVVHLNRSGRVRRPSTFAPTRVRSFIALTGARHPTSVPAASCHQRPLPRLPP